MDLTEQFNSSINEDESNLRKLNNYELPFFIDYTLSGDSVNTVVRFSFGHVRFVSSLKDIEILSDTVNNIYHMYFPTSDTICNLSVNLGSEVVATEIAKTLSIELKKFNFETLQKG